MCASWRTRCTAPCCSRAGAEIGIDGILSPDGGRLDQARGTGAAAHAAMAAEQVTRNLVGRTVAEVERDLILETLKHCLGNRTHAANILGISIRTLRNKLNEYAADGAPIPPPGGGEACAARRNRLIRRRCLRPRRERVGNSSASPPLTAHAGARLSQSERRGERSRARRTFSRR